MTKYSKLLSQIIGYLKDKLTNNERHALEQEINADPFLSDAMDGFQKLPPQELEHDLAALTAKLNNRAQPKQDKNLYLYISVAASVTIIMGISIFYYNTNTNNTQLAENIESKKDDKISKIVAPIKQLKEVNDSATTQLSKPKQQPSTPPANSDEAKKRRKTKPTTKAHKVIQHKKQLARGRKVTGVVKGDDNTPLPGANVIVKGTTGGTVSDFDGEYELNVKPGDTLAYSFIGFEPKEGVVSNEVAQLDDVTLNQDPNVMNEVVVVGYGTTKRKVVTGAVTRISEESIANASKAKSSHLQGNRLLSEESEKPVIIKQETYTPEGGFRKFRKYIKTNKRIQLDTKFQVELTLDQAGKPIQIQVLTPCVDEVSTEVTRLFTQGPLWQRKSKTYDSSNNKTTVTIKL